MYSEERLYASVSQKRLAGASLRAIARELGHGINQADIHRILRKDFPKTTRKRNQLGLPALIPAPACVKCGNVHTTKRCTREAAKKKRARRVAVRCDDMRSAANTLLRNLDAIQVDELIKLLQKGGET